MIDQADLEVAEVADDGAAAGCGFASLWGCLRRALGCLTRTRRRRHGRPMERFITRWNLEAEDVSRRIPFVKLFYYI